MVIDKEHISFLLEDEYSFIGDYLGNLIFQRLSLPEPEKCVLINHLVEKENSFDLYDLDQTLMYGEEYCERFKELFNIDLNNKQKPDWEFTSIFAKLRAFEFLSKNKFRHIKWIGDEQNGGISFISNRNNIHFALSIKLSIGIDDFLTSFDNSMANDLSFEYLKGEIYSALSTQYENLHSYCSSQISCQGILFISFGKDYLVNKRHKLPEFVLPKISAVLNEEWFALKDQGEKYKYLANIVLLIGIKGRDIIVYPKLRSSNLVY